MSDRYDAKTPTNLLDMPVLSKAHLNLETVLYILLGAIAIVACFTNLGVRTQSHDESLHALYSWKLYAGEGYEHNPMMHGPFLFHINALMYLLFGVSDFTSRISTALFGVILVLLPAFLRKELGRVGALIVSVLTLISPTTLYYARYIRNDIYMMVWALLMAIALFRYMRSRKVGWIYLGALAVVLSLTTKETAYITGFIGFVYVVMLVLRNMLSARAARVASVVLIALLVVSAIGYMVLGSVVEGMPVSPAEGEAPGLTPERLTQVREIVLLMVGIVATMLLGMVLIQRDEKIKPALTLIVAYVVAIAGLVVLCAGAGGLAWVIVAQLPEGVVSSTFFVVLQVVAVGVAIAAGSYVWWWLLRRAKRSGQLPAEFSDRVLYISVAIVVIVFVLLYTTFFTNPKGLGTGTFGAVGYWLAQQEVKRAGQPWFYYLIIAPLYEFLPIAVGLAATLYYLITGRVDRPKDRAAEVKSLPFVGYLVYWTLSAWLIYSWAGEKMPWMLVHVVQPMIVLSGRFADDLLHGVDWRKVWRAGGALLALLLPILLFAVGMVVALPVVGQAFKGMSLNDLGDTARWLLALVIGGGVAWAAYAIAKRLGWADAGRMALVSVLVLGALLTVRFAVMASFVNYDTAKEFLVYAHGSPDVKRTVEELQMISRRLYGDDHSIRVAYSSDATWPFEWYMDTLFPNRVFFGREPGRESTDVPVLIVGRDEIAKTEPFLGNRYYRFDRKLVWWPHQDYYMGLSLAIPSEENRLANKNYFMIDMRDPEKRRAFWNVLFYRKYDQSLADWQPSHPFAFYVRKDVAAQIWDYGVAPGAVDLDEPRDLYDEKTRGLETAMVLGGLGSDMGLLNTPRDVAIGPDGAVYVADSGNHRIQKYAADGTFLTAWGHSCKMYENMEGCQATDGAGGFYDPWGVAVGGDGSVYVADTWNHRVQKFTADGTFVTMWGTYGVAETGTGAPGLFWGPRGIAVDAEGMVYVADTGNKRVQVFTAAGAYVTQWGGKGVLEGEFDEPVGIAIGADGLAYVADTWNQRIQKFSEAHVFLREWPVDTWHGQSLENKPFLAVDALGRVYASDPEGYRILVFNGDGVFLTSIGQYGEDDQSFKLPTGIAVDGAGYVWVADPATHRVLKLAPVQ
ncbi:MAG: TIGR03663 family protein [Anaerolineae bacterium]|nr:TIGR03663 family protein [Anaerolineae bacterium]